MLESPLLLHCFGILSTHFAESPLHILPHLRSRHAELRRNLALVSACHLHLNDATAAFLRCYALPILSRHFSPDCSPLL